jgi:hypothetical protein
MKPNIESSLRRQAAETLKRARATPRGPFRNDLRQLATALRGLDRQQHHLFHLRAIPAIAQPERKGDVS